MISIRQATQQDKFKWDDYVLSQNEGSPYHLFAWKEAIEDAYGHETLYIMAEDDRGKIQGALPFVMVKAPFMQGELVSQPFCDYAGVLSETENIRELLVDYAIDHVCRTDSKMEIRSRYPDAILEKRLVLIDSIFKTRMVLELPDSSENLMKSFKSKLRSQIRKPQKEGLTFVWGSLDTAKDFYGVFSRNMRDLGSPVHSFGFITSVMQYFQSRAKMGIVYQGKDPIGAGIILLGKDTVCIPWASTLKEYNKLSPNMLLYWHFLEYASDNGFRYFDFGRSTPGEGTYKFKEQWGAQPVPLCWYGQARGNKKRKSETQRTLRRKVEFVWSRIPLPLTNLLGPYIRKYISL